MKTLLYSFFALSFALSCNVKSDTGFGFNIIQKTGKGPLQTKNFPGDFDEITVSQAISAEVIKSDAEKVSITAPSDIIDDILVDNAKGKLHIHFKPNVNIATRNITVKIYARDFSALEANSSATVKIRDRFTQDKTNVKVSSSADISGDLEANSLTIKVSSSGTFKGKIWAINLSSEVSSSGDIILSGKTKVATLQASSSGTLNADKVEAENVNARASSSGTIRITASNELRAGASSSGDIIVKRNGNLNIVERSESSSGSVTVN